MGDIKASLNQTFTLYLSLTFHHHPQNKLISQDSPSPPSFEAVQTELTWFPFNKIIDILWAEKIGGFNIKYILVSWIFLMIGSKFHKAIHWLNGGRLWKGCSVNINDISRWLIIK